MINSTQSDQNPWLALVILSVLSFGTAMVSPLVYSYVVALASGVSYGDIVSAFSFPESYPELKSALLTVQFLTSVTAFILVPLYFIRQYEKSPLTAFVSWNRTDPSALLSTAFLVLSFMVVNSVFIEWNMQIEFPNGLHETARDMEDRAKALTEYFTDFDSPLYFAYTLLVVAVVPAIGEELLFRGLIQKQIFRISGHTHVAVWLAAIFFSAFHFQFFGFVPRMLLGALFGYMYVYSGNLAYPMFAHFVNNGFTLLMVYLHQNGQVDFDIESTESVPLESVVIFAIIGTVLFVFFYKKVKPLMPATDE